MLSSMLSVLGLMTVRGRFDDPDVWWHLRTGEWIWTTHVIPTTDIFSYTAAHHPWVPHEWLSQCLIYLAYKFGGYSGLMFWLFMFSAALLIAGYALCTIYSGNAKVAFAGALVIWLFSTVSLAIRPQIIGYLFLVLELILLQIGRTRNPRWFFWLPPLFAVWVNCHGSFFFGLIVAGVLLFCSFFEFQSGLLVSSRWDPRHRRFLAIALAISAAALFLNPVGIHQVLYPLNTMFKQPVNLSQISEWRPLTFSGPRGLGLLAVLGSIFLLALVQRSEIMWDELILLGIGVWLAGHHHRMLIVFGILAAPVLSRQLSTAWETYDAATDRPLANAVMILLACTVAFFAFPKHSYLERQVEENSPVKAVQFIKSHHLTGPMLNEYAYGGYLIWAAPEYPVFMDGRADVYEWAGVLTKFGKWATLQSDPNTLLNNYDINFCLLARSSPMTHVLPLLHNWRLAYSDANSVIFTRIPNQ